MAKSNVTQKMMEKSAEMALEMTAKMFGMDTSTVAKILQIGIPMQMKMISENPDLAKKMYATSFEMMPEQVQEFYGDLLSDPKLAEVSQEEYKQFFGAAANAINAAAAEQVSEVSEEQVEKIMGTMWPMFKAEVRDAAEEGSVYESDFGAWLGEQAAEA